MCLRELRRQRTAQLQHTGFPECRVFVGLSENILSKDTAFELRYIYMEPEA